MEKKLLQSLLLDERADHVESETLGADFVKSALDGFNSSLAIASELQGNIGTYHQVRCMYHLASFLLKRGEMLRGDEVLDISLKKSKENGFGPLAIDLEKLAGFYKDDLVEGTSYLESAMISARKFGNTRELAELMFVKGNRTVSESEDRPSIEAGIALMMEAAGIVDDMDERMKGASMRTEAALWFARTGSPGDGVDLARKASQLFKEQKDRESMIRALSVLFLCYMKMDDRRKAKRLLLDLVANQPVKQFPASFGILKEAVSGVKWLREDKDTKELFEEEIVYTIERVAVDEVIRRARESYPNEFGAMLRGLPHITHIEPVMEGAGNRNSFLFSLYSRFSQRNVPGEGVVHSHPSGSARPSRADLSMFGRFPGINIIIGYPYSYDSMAAYDRLGNRVRLEIVNPRKRVKK
jgi:proteasome lid subunit RPN8/RPN11